MCLLTYLPPKTQPNLNRLDDGCDANPDGFGWAIVTASNGLLVGKGLQHESVLLEFAEMRREFPEGPALFHSRITTHGSTTIDNCHPFYVKNDQRTVLAHNGILPGSVQPANGDLRSDTRIAAESWIPRNMGAIWKPGVRRTVERWMGRFNKMVVLTVDPRSQYSAYILNEEAGHWAEDGCWYSNTSYLQGRWRWVAGTVIGSYGSGYFGGTTSKKNLPAPVEASCVMCSAVGWDGEKQYCPWCGSCQDCLEDKRDCLCYIPVGIPSSEAAFRAALSELD